MSGRDKKSADKSDFHVKTIIITEIIYIKGSKYVLKNFFNSSIVLKVTDKINEDYYVFKRPRKCNHSCYSSQLNVP